MSGEYLARGDGPKGSWAEVDPEPLNVDQLAGLCVYLLDVPGAAPWHQYVMTAIHLRMIEGQTIAPTKRFPAATHEIIVLALDPKEPPEPPWPYILPPNVTAQFACSDDEIVRAVTRKAAEGVVHGVVPIEYPFEMPVGDRMVTVHELTPGANRAMSEYWEGTIRNTIEHHITGGHT